MSVVVTGVMIVIPTYFYSRSGKFVFWAFYIFLSFSCVLRLYILHGYTRLYYSHLAILEMSLIFFIAIQTS